MTFVGIDPGACGAVAALDKAGRVLGVWDTPTIVVQKSSGKRTEYLPKHMCRILELETMSVQLLCLELVNAMPGQGTRSMFSMGRGVGTWEGIIAALDLPLLYVTPQVWKKALGLKGSDKSASILKAQQIIPGAAPHLMLKKHDGRAEAMLIAEYGRRRALGIGSPPASRS